MQTFTSEAESKSLDLSICVHHYTLRAPCPKGQGTDHADSTNVESFLRQWRAVIRSIQFTVRKDTIFVIYLLDIAPKPCT